MMKNRVGRRWGRAVLLGKAGERVHCEACGHVLSMDSRVVRFGARLLHAACDAYQKGKGPFPGWPVRGVST